MKKLLAAVTSFAMSASLMTSAFASSFNVSAAGRVSAVQPNVSMEEVSDVAVNKTAQADFVVTPEEVSVNPGETVKVKLLADAGSHKVGTFVIALNDSDLPQGITADVATADLRCKAVSGTYTFNKLNGKYYCDTLDGGEPMEIDSSKAVIAFTLTVPASATPGDYTYDLSEFHVVEDGYNGVEFDATVKPGVIHILGAGGTTAATTTGGNTPAGNTTTAGGRTPTGNEDKNFVVTPENVEVNPGEDVSISIFCENPDNRKVGQFVVQLKDESLPIKGATATMSSTKCLAVSGTHNYENLNGTWYCDTLDSGEPQEINSEKAVARYKVSIPADATPGEYTWYLDRFHVVEDGYNGVEFDATIKPGTITVLGEGGTTTTSNDTPTTTKPNGTKPANVDEDFIVRPKDVEVNPGEKVNIGIYAENNSGRQVAQFVVRVDDENLPIEGATATMSSKRCTAVSGTHSYEEIDGTWYCDTLDSGDPQDINTENPVARFEISIPADAKAGEYEWQPDRFHVVENGYEAIEFDANIQPGKIVVLGDDTSTTTTTTTTVTTTTTTATTAAPADGEVEWKIPTVNAKAGETVKVNVVVNGDSDLAVAGAQFKITPASPVEFASVADTTAAYKADVQNNAKTNEFAFAEAAGKSTAADDGAVVLSLSYKVPANASGTYALKWSDAFVSDANGNDITDKVTLTDGAIVVAAADGDITWQIPTVHAKAGKTAALNVTVSDPEAAALAVAGAQFAIEADTVEFSSVNAESAAYKSEIVNNKETNEFAFGEGKGAGVAAADGATVMTLTYNVPAGTKPGTYNVSWAGDIFISDTDGNDITAKVALVDGAIIVDDDSVAGDVTWTIPEKHAAPGETVEMDVLVSVNGENLAVGGAQFNIIAKTPIALSGAEGSDGYKADIEYNMDTNEFAFAEGKGAGVEAADGTSVLKLTYTVPEDAQPGEYPVEWSNAFISDTNGNDITANVTLVNGVIIIDDESTTSGSSTTTGSETTTTTDSDITTTTDSDITTTSSESTTSTTITVPDGAVIWQIQKVEAEAGETVTVPVLVLDPNGSKLPVGGAQFGVTAESPIAYDSVSGKSAAYGSDIVANASTYEFAFADAKGAETVGADGAVVFNLVYTVPEGTAAGEYAVEWTKDFFGAANANGEDISKYIVCLDGAIIVKDNSTTTTTETTTTTDTTDTTDTTTTASTTASTAETTTTLTVAEGSVIWQVKSVTAAPGEEVEVEIIVLDPNASNLEVGGAQFVVNCDGAALTGGTGSDAYGAEITQGEGDDANRFAFAHAKGEGIAAENGAKVITLKYKVPEDAKDGDKYAINIADLVASDTNGLDITKHILAIGGEISVVDKTTTTTTTTTEATTTTAEDSTTTTTATASTTAPVSTTIPEGAVIWQIQRVEANPGETVTVPVLVIDPNGAKLPVGGAQFGITAKTPIVYDSVSDTSAAYGAKVDSNASTFEFAFASADGSEIVGENGATVINLTYTVPEGTAAGEYAVEWNKEFFNASNSNGDDISKYIICLDGAIVVKDVASTTTTDTDAPDDTGSTTTETTASTTESTTASDEGTTTASDVVSTTASDEGSTTTSSETSTTASDEGSTTSSTASTTATESGTQTTVSGEAAEGKIVAEVTAVDGFYFNHDVRTFNKGHVEGMKLTLVKADGTEEALTVDESLISFKEQVSGKDTPNDAYREEQTNFTYIVDVLYDGKPLEDKDGKPITFKAYIGVKGDSNLDNKADAKDASNALAFYAKASTMAEGESTDSIRLNPDANEIINNNPDLDLDQFGAFLVDVDMDVYDADNWKTKKSGRVIDAKDASWILKYYSMMSTGETDRQKAWNETVLGREEKIADYLIK